jgi:hypothetical protein
MEDHMRKSVIPVAFAIVAALSLPAQAAKFNCTFYQNGNPVSSACPVDSAGTAKPCTHKYSATLFGTCTGAGGQIGCIFSSEQLAAERDFFGAANSRTLSAGPGLLAGAIVEASTKRLLAGYKENQSTPEVDAVCE